jgi:hypothetical protein
MSLETDLTTNDDRFLYTHVGSATTTRQVDQSLVFLPEQYLRYVVRTGAQVAKVVQQNYMIT